MRTFLFSSLVIFAMWTFVICTPAIAASHSMGWPEAVAKLSGERTKAVSCAGVFKRYGTAATQAVAAASYDSARVHYVTVIAGLITALSEPSGPAALPTLENELDAGSERLRSFCSDAYELLPKTPGQKSALEEIVKAAIEPVIGALKDAVGTLYSDHRKDAAARRETISAQLKAAEWPTFSDIKSK